MDSQARRSKIFPYRPRTRMERYARGSHQTTNPLSGIMDPWLGLTTCAFLLSLVEVCRQVQENDMSCIEAINGDHLPK